MNQNVYISDIDPKTGLIFVGCSLNECQNCHASMFCNVKGQSFQVRNPDHLELKKGDYINIFLPPGRTILSSVILFVLPLALFPLFYLLTPSDNEFIRAFIGLGAMALGFLVAYLIFKNKKTKWMPVVVSKLQPPLVTKPEELKSKKTDTSK